MHFTDDGYSGGSFERLAWKKLIEGVENNVIDTLYEDNVSGKLREDTGSWNIPKFYWFELPQKEAKELTQEELEELKKLRKKREKKREYNYRYMKKLKEAGR